MGKGCKFVISEMALGTGTIAWCGHFKYLGVTFISGCKLSVDTEVIRRKFFITCNSVFGNTRTLDELLQLQLQESFCLPLLQYALCAVKLNESQRADLNSCWNTVFRRIFQFRKHDSVSLFICGLGRLDLKHLLTYLELKFIKNSLFCSNTVVTYVTKVFIISQEFKRVCNRVDIDSANFCHFTFSKIRTTVYEHFARSVNFCNA